MAFIDSGKNFDKNEHHEKMKSRLENMDVSSYLLRMPAPLYKKVKMKLAKDNKKLKSVLIEMLEQYINI